MTDDTTTGGKLGDGGTPKQAGQGTTQPQTGATGGKPGTDGTSGQDDYAELRAAIAKERDRADAAEKRAKTIEEKDLPEAERTKRERDELKAKESGWVRERQDLRMEIQAVRVAAKLGFADAEDALGWLTRNRDQIEFDDKANATNLERLLRELVKSKPHLLAETARPRGSAEGGARGTGAPVDFNAAIRRAAGRSG